MDPAELPVELADEGRRLGRRLLREIRSGIDLAIVQGVQTADIRDWLVGNGCSVELAEWLIERRRVQFEGGSFRDLMLIKPLKVRSLGEVLAALGLAAAWMFLSGTVLLVGEKLWRGLLTPFAGIAFLIAFLVFLARLSELHECYEEWRDRR